MIYLNSTMRAYEKFRLLLTKVFHNFNLVSEIDESLFSNKGDYFSFITLEGVSIYEEEFSSRKKLLDLLKVLKKLFYEAFNVEVIEAKKYGKREIYSLLFVDENKESYELVKFELSNINNLFIINYSVLNLIEHINKIISSRYNNLSCFEFNEKQIAILIIQKNKEGVLSKVKKIKEELSEYKFKVYDSFDNLLDKENALLKDYSLVIEIGPGNIRKKQITIIDKTNKYQIEEDILLTKVKSLIEEMNKKFYQASLKNVLSYNSKCVEFSKLSVGNRFLVCEDKSCLKQIENQLKTKDFYQPFAGIKFSKKCIICSKEANNIIFATKNKKTQKNN